VTARRCATIIQPGRNAEPTTRTDAAGVLVDGAGYYRAFYRSALTARHYILMSGWQFDSTVALVRGDDAPVGAEVQFLRCLDGLCARRPTLHVYILAWDFHLVFIPEREWLQRVVFHWMTNARFHFRFDDNPIAGGSHHQKFVIIDGALAFVGSADICESRWDDRRHLALNPLRVSRGRVTKPYHEVQAYLVGGDAVTRLRDMFVSRWARAGGEPSRCRPVTSTGST
jgi:phospholipase D1/2